ncbi:Elongation Factor-Like Gtpase 1 [Manis pentadactyla]|nr:Elongation Factor-Like Gtpase 1 [Manis pentadactyla]
MRQGREKTILKKEEELRYMDSRDEQIRGITMKSSAISLHYTNDFKSFVASIFRTCISLFSVEYSSKTWSLPHASLPHSILSLGWSSLPVAPPEPCDGKHSVHAVGRLCVRQEEQLAGALATGTEEKCRLIDKLRATEEASTPRERNDIPKATRSRMRK